MKKNTPIDDNCGLDHAVTPSAALRTHLRQRQRFHVLMACSITLASTVSAFVGGIDMGDAVVASDGSVTVPINQTGGQYSGDLFTDAKLTALMNSGINYGNLAVPTDQTVDVQYPIPSGQTIQSYISSAISTCTGIIDDYAHNRMFSYWQGSGTSGGIAIFNRFTGAKIIDATAAAIVATTANQPTSATIPSARRSGDRMGSRIARPARRTALCCARSVRTISLS